MAKRFSHGGAEADKAKQDVHETAAAAAGSKSKRRLPALYQFLIGFFGCIVLICCGLWCVYSYYYGLLNYQPAGAQATSAVSGGTVSSSKPISLPPQSSAAESVLHTDHTAPITGTDEESLYYEELRQNAEESTLPLLSDSAVTNILLVGCDSFGSGGARSDSMILLSINTKKQTMYLTSILRDSCVYIPGHGYSKINAAFAWGGADLLLQTIEINYKVKVDRYAAVDFVTFVDAVNILGGIPMYITDNEVYYVNECTKQECDNMGLARSDYLLDTGGSYWLNGIQALSYSRVRYDSSDFTRTQRQRSVITAAVQQTAGKSISQISGLAEAVLPYVTTNIPSGEMASLLLNALSYMNYDIAGGALPVDGSWSNIWLSDGSQALKVDISANIAYLRDVVYG